MYKSCRFIILFSSLVFTHVCDCQWEKFTSVPFQMTGKGLTVDLKLNFNKLKLKYYAELFPTTVHEDVANSTLEHVRRKRTVIFADPPQDLARARRKTLSLEKEGTLVISNVKRANPQYFDNVNAIDINFQRVQSDTLVFSIEEGDAGRELKLQKLTGRDLKQTPMFSTIARDSVAVDVFEIKDTMFAFTTVNHDPQSVESPDTINTGSTLYKINFGNQTFDKTQTIHLPFAKSSAVWTGMGEEANDIFLAIAPEKAISVSRTTYDVIIPCYRWQGGYFDYVSEVPASNPQSIQHFGMYSHDYLVVANYQDNTGSTSVKSEIFKYFHKEQRFASFQKIQTYGAKDIRHFTFENSEGRQQEHFIVIANNCKRDENGNPQYLIQSTIMKFSGFRFLPFKSVYTYGAQQFLPVKHEDKRFLALADMHGIRMFQYNGWTFVQTYSTQYTTVQHSPFSVSLRELNINDKSFFTVASQAKGVQNGVFAVNFETKNDHKKLISSVSSWCDAAQNQVNSKDLSDIESKIDAAPKITDETIVIDGSVTFTQGVQVNNLKSQALSMGRGRNLGEKEFNSIANNERFFRMLVQRAVGVDSTLKDACRVNQDELIQGDIKFMSIFYQNKELQITNLQVERFGSVIVDNHLKNLIFLDQPQSLRNIVTEDVQVQDLGVFKLNGQPIKDYALRNPNMKQAFTGSNEFRALAQVSGAIQSQGRFANLNFNKPDFLLVEGNQTFAGASMNLNQVVVTNLYTRYLNGHDVFFYVADAVKLSGGTIEVEKQFQNLEVQSLSVKTLNNINVDVMFKQAIYTDGRSQQEFTGTTYFENVVVGAISPENPNINGKFDPTLSFINIENGEYTIQKLKVSRGTKIEDLFVESQLNNIRVQDAKLDVLLKNSPEPQIVKSKTLQSVKFFTDVEANELVDGVALSIWSPVKEIHLENTDIQGIFTVLGNIIAEKGVRASDSFQQGNSDVLNVLMKSAPLDAEMLPGSCKIQFENLKVTGNSDVRGVVNNVKPSSWVINSERQEVTITAEKIFKSTLHLDKDVEANALYGSTDENTENVLSVFPNLLLDGVDQTITQNMAFTAGLEVEQAFCPDTILNEIPFENMLFKKGNQVVHVESVFRAPLVAIGDVTVFEDLHATLVNDININDELKNTLRTAGGVQTISAEYSFTDLAVKSAQVDGSFASSDVQTIYGNIILKNRKDISVLKGGQLSFLDIVTLDRLDFVGTMNGIHASDWGEAWLLSGTDQVVNSKVIFEEQLSARSIQAPSVNGIDVSELSSQIVRTDGFQSFSGTVTFMGPVNAASGINMPNTVNVNGVDLSRDVLLKSSPELQDVQAETNFMDGVTVDGNLFVQDFTNFDMSNFATLLQPGVTINSDGSLQSLVINGNLNLKNEPNFQTRVNDHQWTEVLRSIWFKDRSVILRSPVQFSTVEFPNGKLVVPSTKLNGVDLKDLLNNYASKTRDQEWTGNVIIENVDSVNHLVVDSIILQNDGLFNGENLKEFYESVLTYTGDQNLHGNLVVDQVGTVRLDTTDGSTINSLTLDDFMTHTKPNILHSSKKFDNIIADTITISPSTVINGVNMGDWNDNAVRRTGSFNVRGPVEFETLQTTENVVVNGLVDGIEYNVENVFTTDQDQVILGPVHIMKSDGLPSASLTAPGGVTIKGKMNDLDVTESISKLVFKDDMTPIIIEGETIFDSPVVMNQVKTEALVQGQNIAEVVDRFSRAQGEIESHNFVARERYENLLSLTMKMLAASENQAVFLDYYILTQTIQVPATYVKILKEVGYPAIAIGFQKSAATMTENWWSFNAALDYYQLQIGNRVQLEGLVKDIAELPHGSDNLIAFAVNSDGSKKPAQTSMELRTTTKDFEINKSSDKLNKAFVLKSIDKGTAFVRPAISQVIYSDPFESIHSFSVMSENDLKSCMVATTRIMEETESSTKIFCLDSASGLLNTVQEINFDSPSLTSSTVVEDQTLLMFLTRSGNEQPEGLLEIWKTVSSESVMFVKQHCLPVFNGISIDSLTTEDGKTFLAIASGSLKGTGGYQGAVFIYRYSSETEQFSKTQTIEINHPVDVKLQRLKPSNEIIAYVLSDSLTNNVQIYKYQGLAGWSIAHQFTSENGKSLAVSDFTLDGIYRAQLLVTSPTQTNIYAAEFKGRNIVVEDTMTEFESRSTNIDEVIGIDFDNL